MSPHIQELFDGIRAADRRSLGKALSFVESNREEDRADRDALLSLIAPYAQRSRRIGISGSPGAGKSTLIEHLGLEELRRGHNVAVLAIDPSSSISGGSILGDKIRMPELSKSDKAFIRPSPAGAQSGGTAPRTREAIMVCEAAGFDTVVVETVGVGQAELSIASMIDVFVLVLLPAAGDDVQAVKRGIMEVADIIFLNKSDLDERQSAVAYATLQGVRGLLRARFAQWTLEIVRGSALKDDGITALSDSIALFFERCADEIEQRRRQQRGQWFDELLRDFVIRRYFASEALQRQWSEIREQVEEGSIMAPAAVALLGETRQRSAPTSR